MVKARNSAGFTHIFLLLGLLVLVLVIGLTTFKVLKDDQQHNKAVQNERALYAKLDSEAQQYIQAINAKYPGKVTHKRSCSYTSTEVGRGALSCGVESNIEYPPNAIPHQVFEAADTARESIPWGKGNDITNTSKATFNDVVRDTLYRQDQKQSCDISYYDSSGGVLIDAACSGGALAEYYPVVSNEFVAPSK